MPTKHQPTERIAMRLPVAMIEKLDKLVADGAYRSRTHAVFEAVRDYLAKQKGAK
jgi:Arc/MetJ-type ribon-helix-helix transcriptional regulator